MNLRAAFGLAGVLLGVIAGTAPAGGIPAEPASGAPLSLKRKSDAVGGKTFAVRIVTVSLAEYRLRVGLAQGRVGATEPLESIARRYGADAAINGCFFNAYIQGPIKAPYHHIITRGRLVHTGNTGTTLGFDAAGRYAMERVRLSLLGGLDDRWVYPDNWYAYFLNHPIESSNAAVIYTPHWAGDRTPAMGLKVVVRAGAVAVVGEGAYPVPSNGYVLALAGRERYLAGRFQIGRRVSYRLVIRAPHPEFWEQVQEAIECGPRLLRAGEVSVDALAEGFSHPKIVTLSSQRSAVGMTRSGMLLLVTCANATIVELAGVLRALGAYDAMNLDGGASSGLWAQGRYVEGPGRDISHALLIFRP
ncbi:MAG: phosphodiester glycosidase family protein [Armatimonadota bacterium]